MNLESLLISGAAVIITTKSKEIFAGTFIKFGGYGYPGGAAVIRCFARNEEVPVAINNLKNVIIVNSYTEHLF